MVSENTEHARFRSKTFSKLPVVQSVQRLNRANTFYALYRTLRLSGLILVTLVLCCYSSLARQFFNVHTAQSRVLGQNTLQSSPREEELQRRASSLRGLERGARTIQKTDVAQSTKESTGGADDVGEEDERTEIYENPSAKKGSMLTSTKNNLSAATKTTEARKYLGTCYDACEKVRNLLLGPGFEIETVLRLRSATCVHFIPGGGFCDSMISKGRMQEEIFTPEYFEAGRNFFGNVSKALPPSVGGFIVFIPSDSTDYVLDHEIDALWDSNIPFVPHCISKRETSNYIMMPDFHFIYDRGFSGFREFIDNSGKPYSQRAAVVFWRGSSTSGGLECQSANELASRGNLSQSACSKTLRVQVALQALKIPHVDAKIVAATDCCKDMKDEMSVAGIMDNRVHEFDWTNNRGMLEIDGLVNAWGFYWRLYSGSVVFRIKSKYLAFYDDRLEPWKHYIPVESNLSDLRERASLVISNRTVDVERLSTIAKNAKEAMSHITYDGEVQRVAKSLVEAWQTRNGDGQEK